MSISLVGLLVSFPLIAGIAIFVLFCQRTPVFFRQERPGLNEKPFNMIKFTTMRDDRNADGELLPDADRITRFGTFLRRTSLDELPELWNVLIGDMSLVGPRPLLVSYLERYTDEQRRRHHVRPGVTGLAQVSGRQAIPFSKRLALDVWYVDNVSFWLDLKLLWRTVFRVFSNEGVIVGQDVVDVDDIGLSVKTNALSAEREGE